MPDADTDPFLVFQIEARAEPAPLTALAKKVPAMYKFKQIGCFFADTSDTACQMAAQSLNQLGYFVAVKAKSPVLAFDPRGELELPQYLPEKEPDGPPAAAGQ
jgi:hypothetical protein